MITVVPAAMPNSASTEERAVDGSVRVAIACTQYAMVHRLAKRLTSNAFDADDLTQDVFVRALRSLPTTRPENMEGWLYRITVNLFLDRARARRRLSLLLTDEATEQLVDHRADPAELLDDALLSPGLATALRGLPDRYLTPVLLRDLAGLSYADIAARLEVNRSTVASRIHRGRTHLRMTLCAGGGGGVSTVARYVARPA